MDEVDRLLNRMWRQVEAWQRAGDHRAVFLTVYATMTGCVRDHLAAGAFLDPAWVIRLTLRFAQVYFAWVEAYDRGQPVPRAWQMAFDLCRRRAGFVLQDALLGVNAHICYDLALTEEALLRAEGDHTWEGLLRRRFDHDQINRALVDAIPPVQAELRRRFARWLFPLERAGKHLDERLAALGLKYYRTRVWRNALWLLATRNEAERAVVVRRIDREAVEVAQQILFAGRLDLAPVRALARLCRRWRLL